MELQAKVYIILTLVFVVLIIHMANIRKKSNRQTKFPLLINAFRADFATLNPLKVSYYLKHMGSQFRFIPMISNEIFEYLSELDKELKFNQKRSKSYFIKLNADMQDQDVDLFTKEFSLKFDVVKIETKTDGSYDILIKEKFTQFNLTRMTKFVTEYLKKVDPYIISEAHDISEESNIMQ